MGGHPAVFVTGRGRQTDEVRARLGDAGVAPILDEFTSGQDSPATPVVCLVVVEESSDSEMLVAELTHARRDWPSASLVVFGPLTGSTSLVDAVRAGADGWIDPASPPEALTAALGAVVRGESGFSRSATRHLVAEVRRSSAALASDGPVLAPAGPDPQGLTPREREVLEAQRAGHSVREIATQLSLSEVTVRWHAGRAGKKVEAATARPSPRAVHAVPGTAASPTRAPARPRVPARQGRLTRSELRVALLVSDGLSNKQIAEQLFISRHTVESHLKHAFAKLGVRSRVELTRVVLADVTRTA